MTQRPETVPEWATDVAADVVEPSLGKKIIGWLIDEKPAPGFLNWWKNLVFRWVDHYSELQVHNWFMSETMAVNVNTNAIASGGLVVQGFTPTLVRAWLGVGGPSGAKPLIYSSYNGEILGLDDAGAVKNFGLNGCVYDASLDVWVLVGDADGSDAYVLSGLPGFGSSWSERANPKNFGLNAVANDGAGLFVAAGVHDGSDIYCITSPDGTTWTERSIPGAAGDRVNGLVWTGTNFVAVGQTGGGAPLIWTSPDGITWTSRTPGATSTGRLARVAYNGTAAIAVGNDGEIHRSLDDGLSWTLPLNPGSSPQDNDLLSVGADPGNGLIVVVQDTVDLVLYSIDDGLTWIYLPHTPRFNSVFEVGADAGGFVLAGSNVLAPAEQTLARSLRLRSG